MSEVCHWCDEHINDHDGVTITIYDTPWEDAGNLVTIHNDCYNEMCEPGYTDFFYQTCDRCDRLICYRYPSNGWHIQFRVDEWGTCCLRCYMNEILHSGQPEDDFDGDVIRGGMFFSGYELEEAGFEEVAAFYIMGHSCAERYNALAREYIANGYDVVTAYNRLSIDGQEGGITLMARKREG